MSTKIDQEQAKSWYVYMIQTRKGKLYTGISTDVTRRFKQHATGKGAKYFLMDTPEKIVFTEACKSRSEALKKEALIKKLDTAAKKKLYA